MEATDLFPETDRMPLYWANLLAKEKIVINPGGTYSGKTQSLVRVCMTFAAARYFPNGITICSGTLTKLKEDAIAIFEGLYSKNAALRRLIKGYNRSEFKITFNNGSTVKFTSFENILQAEGAKCDILYICEAPRLSWGVAYRLIFRTNFKVYLDYNPYNLFWVDDKIIDCKVNPRTGKKEFNSVKVLRSWHIHNHFISQEKRDELENITDEEIWKVYARGLRGKLMGRIYNFKKVDKIPDALPFFFGIDFGYNVDPCAIVKIYYEGRNRYWQPLLYLSENGMLDLIAKENLLITPAQYMARILKNNGCTPSTGVWGDHDKNMSFQLRRERIPFRMVKKGPNSVIAGISKVKSFNNYYLANKELENEHDNYTWEKGVDLMTGNEVYLATPQKGAPDHILDGGRYGISGQAARNGTPDTSGEAEEDGEE